MTTITAVRATPICIPLEAPYDWHPGSYVGFSRAIIEIETSDGITGLGESPTAGDAEMINYALGPLLLGADALDHADCERRCIPPIRGLQTIGNLTLLRVYTGIEIALWDIAGKLYNRSVASLLGGRVRDSIELTEYFAFRPGREETPVDVARYCAAMAERHGSINFEGKVGAHPLAAEVAMVREIRAGVGEESLIRLDANMAWRTAEAREALRRFESLGVTSIEEPVATLQELARLRPTTTIAFSSHEPNLREAANLGVPDAFVVHLFTFGGIRRTMNFVAACDEFGIRVWFRSPDAGVATAAQLQVASAVESMDAPSQSLLRWHTDDVIAEGPFVPKGGCVPVPEGPGLGVTLDQAALERCRDRYAQDGSYDHYTDRPPSAAAVGS